MIEGLGGDEEIVIMKHELAGATLVEEDRHFIGDAFDVALAEAFARSQLMKRRDAAVGATAITSAAAHHVAGGHAGEHVNQAATVGEWDGVEVVGGAACGGEVDLLTVAIGDAGNLRQAFCQVWYGVRDFHERRFSFVDYDEVNSRVMRQEGFGGAGRLVSAGHNELFGIPRLQQLRETEKLLRPRLK